MTNGSRAYYPFPDDGGAALYRVISKLSAADRLAMTWQPTPDWVLEVPPPLSVALAANYARKGVRRLDQTMQSGRLLVPAREVAAIQTALAKRPNATATWSRVEGVEFANARARQTFEALI